ncbi:hypothetical protein JB92DRAFT_3069210 [Gautieria morchelliformis]|nr:hypothetical protein JB92DRAFT_3069210 [Gautieria morchelliformis]
MESLVIAYAHLMGNYKFQTSNYVLYLYDHLLTFPEEVDKIWSQPFTFASLLFYINRYITHCQFIILQVEFYETTWSISVLVSCSFQCSRYVKFAGAATLCLVAVIMILRVYALYLANKYVLVFLLSILSGQIIASSWGVHFGIRVPQPAGFPGCVLTGSSTWFAALWGAPLVTDSCIFILTVWRTLRYKRKHGRMTTMEIILRDGTMYFFAIFSANLMNTLIYFLATEDLKAVGASFSQILTAIMISRLQLNLRQAKRFDITLPGTTRRPKVTSLRNQSLSSGESNSLNNTDSTGTGTFFSLGNLGERLQGSFFEAPDVKETLGEEIELRSSVM